MEDTALLAVALATAAGIVAGRLSLRARGDAAAKARARRSSHYAQGLRHLALGQIDQAARELAKAAQEQPEALEVHSTLALLLRNQGKVEQAIQIHRTLLARDDLSRAERADYWTGLGTDFRHAGFLDRAAQAFDEALQIAPGTVEALVGLRKLHEEQHQWRQAIDVQSRLLRQEGEGASLVLGYLQAELGRQALTAGRAPEAEEAFREALAHDRRVLPAYLGLADFHAATEPLRAAAILEDAIATLPAQAYVAFDALATAYTRGGEPSRFAAFCERWLERDPRDWRVRVALARHLRAHAQADESLGLLLGAIEINPQALAIHLETWRTLGALGRLDEAEGRYLATFEHSAFYSDPHVCTSCRYRVDGMLWRCPHCHEWHSFVEERLTAR
jgi:lipopolysaccharide assembly protein B